jgi:hypothetical protein
MPKLITIRDFGKWGDSILLADSGRIYSVDSTGGIQLLVGGPVNLKTDEAGNDDGGENTCVELALRNLGLDDEPVKSFKRSREDGNVCPIDWSVIEASLSAHQQLNWAGTVGHFIKEHPTGKYFVGTNGHSFALVDGTAFNIRYETPKHEVYRVWRIG